MNKKTSHSLRLSSSYCPLWILKFFTKFFYEKIKRLKIKISQWCSDTEPFRKLVRDLVIFKHGRHLPFRHMDPVDDDRLSESAISGSFINLQGVDETPQTSEPVPLFSYTVPSTEIPPPPSMFTPNTAPPTQPEFQQEASFPHRRPSRSAADMTDSPFPSHDALHSEGKRSPIEAAMHDAALERGRGDSFSFWSMGERPRTESVSLPAKTQESFHVPASLESGTTLDHQPDSHVDLPPVQVPSEQMSPFFDHSTQVLLLYEYHVRTGPCGGGDSAMRGGGWHGRVLAVFLTSTWWD